jgi:hypothetical protein
VQIVEKAMKIVSGCESIESHGLKVFLATVVALISIPCTMSRRMNRLPREKRERLNLSGAHALTPDQALEIIETRPGIAGY